MIAGHDAISCVQDILSSDAACRRRECVEIDETKHTVHGYYTDTYRTCTHRKQLEKAGKAAYRSGEPLETYGLDRAFIIVSFEGRHRQFLSGIFLEQQPSSQHRPQPSRVERRHFSRSIVGRPRSGVANSCDGRLCGAG